MQGIQPSDSTEDVPYSTDHEHVHVLLSRVFDAFVVFTRAVTCREDRDHTTWKTQKTFVTAWDQKIRRCHADNSYNAV